MNDRSSRKESRPSNRITHGLTSSWRTEGWRDNAEKLALDLIGEAPKRPEIMEVAQALALDSILVEATRREKRSVFSEVMAHCKAPVGHPETVAAAMPLMLASHSLRRLDELERKAVSRRRRLMVRLDFLILEELRRGPPRT